MPSFQDSAVLIVLALLLFGPKGLAKLARQAGKLMGEFRRASNDFRLQMEEEFRIEEQADKQKQIAAMKSAEPVVETLGSDLPEAPHPHTPPDPPLHSTYAHSDPDSVFETASAQADAAAQPIASSGSLTMMPPATGLPQPRSGSATSVASAFDSIPHVEPADAVPVQPAVPAAQEHESPVHG